MAVTIKDIAKKLNISYATVSRALRDSPEISQDTKEKVKKAAKEMNYQPNAIARGLVTKKTKTIGLILPDITNPFYPQVARGVEETANQEGYSVFLCNSNYENEKEKAYIDLLISKKVDGIILAPIGEESLKWNHREIPIVIIGRKNVCPQENFVVIDDKKGGYLATEHLIKNGHSKIMFIGGKEKVESNKERLEGYKLALNKNGIQLDANLIRNDHFKRESGHILMKKALQEGIAATAVFAGNDLLALGVLQAIYEYGLKVPQDIAVVGFDNIPTAELPEISLTTIAQPKYKMGVLATQMLLAKIKNPTHRCESIILTPELIVRKTSI